MEIASLALRINTDDVKVAVDALSKLAPAAERAEAGVDGLASTGRKAGEAMSQTAAGSREASDAIEAQIKKWELDAAAIGLTTKQVQLFTLAQKGASDAQLKAANSALSKTGSATTSAGIDAQVAKLQTLAATQGLSAREAKLHQLALEGASKAQLDAADSAIRLNDAYDKGQRIGDGVKTGIKAIALATVAAATAAAVAVQRIASQVSNYQQLSEVVGDTASAIASLQLASDVSGKSLDEAANFSIRLTKALSKTDDEGKMAGRALAAIGIEFDSFKAKSPVTQLEDIAKALKGFDDGAGKTAVLESLVKGGAQLLPFLNDLGDQQQRQTALTDEQIKSADEFTKAASRQGSALKTLAQQIVVQALPSIADLTGSLKDVIEATFGVGKGFESLASQNAVGEFADTAALGLARIADAAAKVGRAISIVAESYGAAAAAVAAVARGEFSVASSIIEDARRQGEQMKDLVSIADTLEKRIAARKATASIGAGGGRGSAEDPRRTDVKKTIDVSGLASDNNKPKKAATPKGGVTEKDLLGLDIALIKRQLDEVAAIYKNSEAVIDATRSAGLIDERAYYESKRGFIRLNAAEQERALMRENVSLQESNDSRRGTDKDRLENDKKIADNIEKITRLRQSAATQELILGIQSESSLRKVAQGFRDAEDAAQEYLDTLKKGQQRDVDGLGLGNRERARQAGRAQIEDRYSGQSQSLAKSRRDAEFAGTFGTEAQERYASELDRIRRFQAEALANYDAYYAERTEKEQSFVTGITEAMNNYVDESRKTADLVASAFTKAFGGIEDAIVSLVTTGKADFKSLANSIIADLVRIQVKKALASAVESASGSGGFISAFFSSVTGGASVVGGRAIGGPVSAGGMYQVNERGRPELLTSGGKQYLLAGSQPGTVSPNSGGATVTNNISVGAGVTRGEVVSLMNGYGNQLRGEILASIRNGGAFSR